MNAFNKTLASLLLFTTMSAQSQAKIRFDWSCTKLSKEKKQQISQGIKEAILSYTKEDYAESGKYDFTKCKRVYKITFHKDNEIATYDTETHIINFDPDLLQNKDYLKSIAVHEFSHAYDFVKKIKQTDKQEEEHAETKENKYYFEHSSIIKNKRLEKYKLIYNGIQDLEKLYSDDKITFNEMDFKWRNLLLEHSDA